MSDTYLTRDGRHLVVRTHRKNGVVARTLTFNTKIEAATIMDVFIEECENKKKEVVKFAEVEYLVKDFDYVRVIDKRDKQKPKIKVVGA